MMDARTFLSRPTECCSTGPSPSATATAVLVVAAWVASCGGSGATPASSTLDGSTNSGSGSVVGAGSGSGSGNTTGSPGGGSGSLSSATGSSATNTGGVSGGVTGSDSGFDSGGIVGASGAPASGNVEDGSVTSTNPSDDAGTNDGNGEGGAAAAPTGLLTNLLAHPENSALTDPTPSFGWIVSSLRNNQIQTAYRVLVSSSLSALSANSGDMWDSGKVPSAESVHVVYAGKPLSAATTYFWKVQTWDSTATASAWSAPQTFVMASTVGSYKTASEPVIQTHNAPMQVSAVGSGHYFVDFGRDAFGWAEVTINSPNAGAVVTVNVGEKANGQSVDLTPGASIYASQSALTLQQGSHTYRIATTKDAAGFALPASLGNVTPLRYVEFVNSPVAITTAAVSQVALTIPFDATASSFTSSNANLDNVWDFSKYTMFATTFAGIYVDGDRERKPYEADAYIHALGHYAVDREFAIARSSHEYLLSNPTWPTEWKQHSIMLAWMDWMYTGNTDSLAQAYNVLATQKLLTQFIQTDGLLNTSSLGCTTSSCGPIVDWPTTERDGFVMTDVNTVVNAFYCRNLQQMADIAAALGKTADAAKYTAMATAAIATFNQKLFNTTTGLYVDGESTTHSSLHANMFPLALGLVPASHVATVTAFVKSRGMACSVYGAQYLLEALYQAGEPDAAVSLMTATSLASWNNMMKVGATMGMEAWDLSIKSNLDWNHAWGAAPANIVARYLLGVTPLTPGFASVAIHPRLGSLTKAEGVVPTIRGPIHVLLASGTTTGFSTTFTLPANMAADVALPASAGAACTPLLDGQPATAVLKGGISWVMSVGSGTHEVHCQ